MEVPLGMPKKNKTGRNCSKQFFAAPAVICYRPGGSSGTQWPHWAAIGPKGPQCHPCPRACVLQYLGTCVRGSTQQIRDPENEAEKWNHFWGGPSVTDSRVSLRPRQFSNQKAALKKEPPLCNLRSYFLLLSGKTSKDMQTYWLG